MGVKVAIDMIWSIAFQCLIILLPWRLRRHLICRTLGFSIAPTASIGISLVAPSSLTMGSGSRIGHLNVIRGMDKLEMGRNSIISHLNWIYAIPGDLMNADRQPKLLLGEGAGITRRHLIDCSDEVRIDRYALVAGYGSQIITHGIDLQASQQKATPILIGENSMIGTRSIVLGGAVMPPYSALGAGSVLRDQFTDSYRIYSGVPAREAGRLPADAAFFSRKQNRVE